MKILNKKIASVRVGSANTCVLLTDLARSYYGGNKRTQMLTMSKQATVIEHPCPPFTQSVLQRLFQNILLKGRRQDKTLLTFSETTHMSTSYKEKAKVVFVREYIRVRFQRLENVCQHWRSSPSQQLVNATIVRQWHYFCNLSRNIITALTKVSKGFSRQ